MLGQPHAIVHGQPEGHLQRSGVPSAKVGDVHGSGWRDESKIHGSVDHVQRRFSVAECRVRGRSGSLCRHCHSGLISFSSEWNMNEFM